MPTFEFTSPRGDTYEVDGPEGSTPEQAFGIVRNVAGLADAIEGRESGGDTGAVSPQGASGAMQIMPVTFQQYATPGQDDFGNEKNRRAAALRKLVDDYVHFGGDMAKTAAAYLGGRGAVRADGTIRDDVHDALGTTPAAYAQQVLRRMGIVAPDGGAGRGTVNPPAVDPSAPEPAQPAARTYTPPEPDTNPETATGGPEILQALQANPDAGAGRGSVNPPEVNPQREVGWQEAMGRGLGGRLAQTGTVPGLLLGAAGVVRDKLMTLASGKEHTEAQDLIFRNLVDPAQSAVDWYALKPEEKEGFLSKIASSVGSLAADLPLMIASGGMAQRAELAQQFPTIARYLENVFSAGFTAMRPVMVTTAAEKAKQVLDNGGTPAQAVNSATAAALWTGITGGQPMSAEGKLWQRAATGFPVGMAQEEAGRVVQNAADPANMQRSFDPAEMAAGGITNAIAAGVMPAVTGHGGSEPAPKDRIDLGYDPLTGKTPVAEAVQGIGQRAQSFEPGKAQPARGPLDEVMSAPTVEAAAQAAAAVATGHGEPSVGDLMRAIRPARPVDLEGEPEERAPADVSPDAAGTEDLPGNAVEAAGAQREAEAGAPPVGTGEPAIEQEHARAPSWLEDPIAQVRPGVEDHDLAMLSRSQEVREHGLPARVPEITSTRDVQALKDHPDYAAAKAGDAQAAVHLVRDLVQPEQLDQAKAWGPAVWVYPHAEEASGRNAIPAMLAHRYASATGGTVDDSIIQANRVFHTGAPPMQRLVARVHFEGDVQPGQRYVLVDDVTTMGGTLADLSDFIRSQGGEVAGVVTLANASRTPTITATRQQIAEIERRHGQALRDTLHVAPGALTSAEAGYVLGFRDADSLRARVAKAAQERAERLRSKGVPADQDGGIAGEGAQPGGPDHPQFSQRDVPPGNEQGSLKRGERTAAEARLIDLRKRASVLDSLIKCLGAE